jgi:hypothetical protein
MQAFNKTINSFLETSNGMDIEALAGANNLKIAFLSGATADYSDTGDMFVQDLLDKGGTILTEVSIAATVNNGVVDAPDVTVTDPGGGATATLAIIREDVGGEASNRMLCGQTVNYTLDGTDDTVQFDVNGIIDITA